MTIFICNEGFTKGVGPLNHCVCHKPSASIFSGHIPPYVYRPASLPRSGVLLVSDWKAGALVHHRDYHLLVTDTKTLETVRS